MTVTGHVPRAYDARVDGRLWRRQRRPSSVRGDTSSDAVKAADPNARRQTRRRRSDGIVERAARTCESKHRSRAFSRASPEAPWPSALVLRQRSKRRVTRPARRARCGAQLAVIKAMHDAGVAIVAGTDYGLPGFSLLREARAVRRGGSCSPLEAIRAATAVPAQVMGMSGEVGTTRETGKRAEPRRAGSRSSIRHPQYPNGALGRCRRPDVRDDGAASCAFRQLRVDYAAGAPPARRFTSS